MNEKHRSALLHGLAICLVLATGWAWFCTMANQTDARILSGKVDAYSIAVVEQIIYSYATTGTWAQTIHTTYTDAWTWSEHRPLWIFPSAWLYGLSPGPLVLGHIQLGIVALGGLFAFGLGHRVLGGVAGGLAAALMWYGSPSLAVVSINVFQELVFGMPWLMLAAWGLRGGRPILFLVGAFACLAAREEWLPAVALLGLGQPGGFMTRVKATASSVAVAVVYLGLLSAIDGPLPSNNPMLVLGHAIAGKLDWHRTPAQIHDFYVPFLAPYALGVLAPLTALPGVAALVFQVLTPKYQTGVDAGWTEHIHHLAPVIGFFTLATVDALGWMRRLVNARKPAWAKFTSWAVLGIAICGTGATSVNWQRIEGLYPAIRLTHAKPAPEWALVDDNVPPDASIATDTHGSLYIARRLHAYTYDDSFEDKLKGNRLAQVDWILLNKNDTAFKAQLLDQPGIVEVARTPHYLLYRLR